MIQNIFLKNKEKTKHFLIYGFFGWFALLVSPVLHAIFDVAFGLIQTLVFVMLTAVFIGNKLDDSEFEM